MANRSDGQNFSTTGRPPDGCWIDEVRVVLRKLMAMSTPVVPVSVKAPEPSALYKLTQLLRSELAKNRPVPPAPPTLAEPTKIGRLGQTYFRRKQLPSQQLRPRQIRHNGSDFKCFSCGKTGHSVNRCPTLDRTFPFLLPGWRAEKTSVGYMMISPRRAMDRRRAENAN